MARPDGFLALGFLGPETEGLLSQLGIAINERGNVVVDSDQMTTAPKIFAAVTCRAGSLWWCGQSLTDVAQLGASIGSWTPGAR
jgi:NADPH-dependent glutamate synthase beta chain and related oxidoreductases